MNKNVNHRIRKHFNEWIYNAARYTEIVLSIVILIVIALAGVRLIYELTEIPIMDMDIDFFTQFLANALSLVVGVEFVKMLCQMVCRLIQKKNIGISINQLAETDLCLLSTAQYPYLTLNMLRGKTAFASAERTSYCV